MQSYIFPTSIELGIVDQNLLPVLTANDPIYSLFPVTEYDAARVAWEQEDDYLGLMQMRGYEGAFPSVPSTGVKRYVVEPGVYGEFDVISELEITERRGFGQIGTPVDLSDIVTRRQKKLATRQYNRMSYIMWTLLATGNYSISGPTGAITKRDSYAPQAYFASVPWATAATATPLADLRAVTRLHRGYSVSFGGNSTAYMNLITWNNLIANSNPNDLGGRRGAGLQTIEGLDFFNKLTMMDNLPQAQIWDEGYKSDGTDGLVAGQFYPFIPDNVAIVVGRRLNGAPIGEFQLTRNASNNNLSSAPLVKVIDSGADPDAPPPRLVRIYRSFNGGPALKLPGSVVVMNV